MRPEIRDILASVAKPLRYTGGEVGSAAKPWEPARARICLAFPDLYEIGTSHLGLSLLYRLVNAHPDFLADRVYAPAGDCEAQLRERGMPLFALESQRSIADFDVVGFSLGYELAFTNVLAMLDLSGIPLRSELRITNHESRFPIIIAGGPCAFNPEPIAPFFDAVVVGDGEGPIIAICEAIARGRERGSSRAETLRELASIEGCFLPHASATEGEGDRLRAMARLADLDAVALTAPPLIPHATVQDRLAVEVARGCTRGCRFCQAGCINRPLRQRSAEAVATALLEGVAARGDEAFSCLSLSLGDWAPLPELLATMQARCGDLPLQAGLPSLRTEALTAPVLAALGRARSGPPTSPERASDSRWRAGSFTLAPEAATERLRRLINKGNSDADLFASVERLFAEGWHAVKLYFMVGLPGETIADVEAIAEVARRCRDIGRRFHKRPEITVSVSTFVPKPHTPFQWERQLSIEETLERQRLLKQRLRMPGVSFRWHGAELSFLEGVLSRGGRELAEVIERAYRAGARFDAWDEHFDLARWRAAFAECVIEPERYLQARPFERPLPWERPGVGPDRAFLIAERERALAGEPTPDCATGPCSHCGMCDFDAVKNRIAMRDQGSGIGDQERQSSVSTPDPCSQIPVPSRVFRYRLRYSKSDRAAFLGPIEALDALRRAMRAAGLPLAVSEGYHPRVRISAGPATPVGIESEAEFIDLLLREECDPEAIVARLVGRLPQGMAVCAAWPLAPDAPAIDEAIALQRYAVDLGAAAIDLDAVLRRFAQAASLPVLRRRKKGTQEIDAKGLVESLAVGEGGVLGVAIRSRRPSLKVGEILSAVFACSPDAVRSARIRKTEVEWRRNQDAQ